MRLTLPALAAAIVLPLAARAADVELVSGPMVGHVTDRSARIWMQLPIAGEVSITAIDLQRNQPVSGLRTDVNGPSPFVCDVPVNNLEPGHSYRLEATFEGKPLRFAGPAPIVRTAPPPGSESPFSIAFGSDLYLTPQTAQRPPLLPIAAAITDFKPRAFFFLGNTGYLPARLDAFPTTRRAAFRAISDLHAAARAWPDLQPLFRSTPCYGIFNDRDFGTPDADRTFIFGPESQVAFQRFWPSPDWGTPQNPGCYCTFTFGDADFFLLDVRTYRDPHAAPAAAGSAPGGAPATAPAALKMLGDGQLQWLQNALKQSRASFKVLVAPCLLFDAPAQPGAPAADGWSRFPAEQATFFQFLADNQVTGILALAGNQPAGNLSQVKLPPSAAGKRVQYPIFTLGTSTLTDVPRDARPPLAALPANGRIGEVVQQNNFGSLSFGGQGEHRFVTLRLHDESNKVRVEQTIFAGQLKNP